MKKNIFTFVLLATISLQGFAQSVTLPATDTKEYEKMKLEGKIPSGTMFENKSTSFQPSFDDLKPTSILFTLETFGVITDSIGNGR